MTLPVSAAVRDGESSRSHALRGLDRLQLAYVQHFDNLSPQAPNEWAFMKGKGFGQEDFGAYRFRLAYEAYALALTHVHRLPAAPEPLQTDLRAYGTTTAAEATRSYEQAWKDFGRVGENGHYCGRGPWVFECDGAVVANGHRCVVESARAPTWLRKVIPSH